MLVQSPRIQVLAFNSTHKIIILYSVKSYLYPHKYLPMSKLQKYHLIYLLLQYYLRIPLEPAPAVFFNRGGVSVAPVSQCN